MQAKNYSYTTSIKCSFSLIRLLQIFCNCKGSMCLKTKIFMCMNRDRMHNFSYSISKFLLIASIKFIWSLRYRYFSMSTGYMSLTLTTENEKMQMQSSCIYG